MQLCSSVHKGNHELFSSTIAWSDWHDSDAGYLSLKMKQLILYAYQLNYLS